MWKVLYKVLVQCICNQLQIHPTTSAQNFVQNSVSVCLSVCLFIYLSVHLSIYPSIHPSVHPSIPPTDRPTHYMERSPSWEANRLSASQEISNILWNLYAHYHFHKRQPPLHAMSQISPVHVSQPISWRSILYYPPTYASVFPLHTCCMPCPSPSWFDHLINI